MFDDTRPIFQQLADRIEDDILNGTYPEESAVPSTNDLALQLRINPATAGKALNVLVDRGVLYKKRGIGMFVMLGAQTLIAGQRRESFSRRFVRPLLEEGVRLGFDASDIVQLIRGESKEHGK